MKWILGLSFLIFAGPSSFQMPDFQSRYPRVESYEVRPGVLATPIYGPGGQLCQVSFEQRHIQQDAVHMQSAMPRKLVLEIINELAPSHERGRPILEVAGDDYLDIISGDSMTTVADYENVSVQIFKMRSGPDDVAAIIEWKHACGPK